ncbi:glutamine synthetase family protein [Nocardia iowensis]|uniref:Glutamine synthetase family protein n=1 Tax=Nocardia iowensis TaxID=204891 RepID=A0ABX8RUX3_NOCIO|nr:glutamine synthetase family protein [Nocardia iowensis]QXN93343.1 glutamine synthetase family protein [Nocardia iowensis]
MATMPERIPSDDDNSALIGRLDADIVALTFVDNAGITRVKTVPMRRLAQAARHGIGVSPCFETFGFDDVMAVGKYLGGPDGDLRLVPDLSMLTELACQPGWAWAPTDKYTQDGTRFAACQRGFAARQAESARRAGLRLSMAFETEWSVGRDDSADFTPAAYGPAYGMVRLGQVADYARELIAVLDRQGILVDQFHPEYAPGQLELSVQPSDPVGAADDAILVRHTIRQVSLQYGWRALLAPCLEPGGTGSGAHLHFSAQDDEGPLFATGDGPYGMRRTGEAFLAGVLRELPALVAVGAGNPASFLRLVPSRWAGIWQCWGRETREAALRFVTGVRGTEEWAANAEVKCFDATGNPYLIVGSVIAAGLAGVAEELRLPAEISGDPVTFDAEQLLISGVRRLPTGPAEAADRLADSAILAEAMGPELHDALLTVRRAEATRYSDTSPEELVALTRWRF